MAEYKYDLELEITLEDFQNSNYEEVLKEASKEGLAYYHTALSKKAAKQIEQGNKKAGKVLSLIHISEPTRRS